MKIHSQIKKHRLENKLSQEALAEQIYVTRQTISNWETGKSYPDIHSLLLLSNVFHVSIDQLIKGDLEKMKQTINKQDIEEFNDYSRIFTVHFILFILAGIPLFMLLEKKAFIPFGLFFIVTMYWAVKVEKLKKKNDVQTYKEIVAFSEGKKLDEIEKLVEVKIRPYQFVLKILISAVITAIICFLIGLLMHLFLN